MTCRSHQGAHLLSDTLHRYFSSSKSKSTDEKKKNPRLSLRERESRVMERVFMETGDERLSFPFRSERKEGHPEGQAVLRGLQREISDWSFSSFI